MKNKPYTKKELKLIASFTDLLEFNKHCKKTNDFLLTNVYREKIIHLANSLNRGDGGIIIKMAKYLDHKGYSIRRWGKNWNSYSWQDRYNKAK